jgi:hypothetical protein
MSANPVASDLLERVTTPSLGSHSKKDLELLLVEFFVGHGLLPESPTEFDLVSKLKITRSKARSLIYERDLRLRDEKWLKNQIIQAITSPAIYVSGQAIYLNISSPLVRDFIQNVLLIRGYATDASFNPSLVKLNPASLSALIAEVIDADRADAIRQMYVELKGLEDDSIQGAISGLLTNYIELKLGETGARHIEAIGSYVGDMFKGAVRRLFK